MKQPLVAGREIEALPSAESTHLKELAPLDCSWISTSTIPISVRKVASSMYVSSSTLAAIGTWVLGAPDEVGLIRIGINTGSESDTGVANDNPRKATHAKRVNTTFFMTVVFVIILLRSSQVYLFKSTVLIRDSLDVNLIFTYLQIIDNQCIVNYFQKSILWFSFLMLRSDTCIIIGQYCPCSNMIHHALFCKDS